MDGFAQPTAEPFRTPRSQYYGKGEDGKRERLIAPFRELS